MILFPFLFLSLASLFHVQCNTSGGGELRIDRGFVARLNPSERLTQDVLMEMYAQHVESITFNSRLEPDPSLENVRNCCLERCPSKVLLNSQCPDRYLIISPWAQFNNLVVIYVHALLLAAKMNRTLLIVDGDLYNYDWPEMFTHHSDLCVRFSGEDEFRDLVERNGRAVRSVVWEERFCESHLLRGVQMERVLLDGGYFRRFATEPYLGCVGDSLPGYHEDKLLFTPCPFFLGVDKESYVDALKSFRINDQVAKVGDALIRDLFHGEPFVGVHLRHFEGSCEKSMDITFNGEKLGRFLKQALKTCEMPWSYIEEQLAKIGVDASKVHVYLATDNQAPHLVKKLLSHSNVFMTTKAILKKYGKVNPLLLDMYMLTKSAYLIGNPYSSLTFHSALWREIDGFNSETNLIPAYQETGYLMHLFLDP